MIAWHSKVDNILLFFTIFMHFPTYNVHFFVFY